MWTQPTPEIQFHLRNAPIVDFFFYKLFYVFINSVIMFDEIFLKNENIQSITYSLNLNNVSSFH